MNGQHVACCVEVLARGTGIGFVYLALTMLGVKMLCVLEVMKRLIILATVLIVMPSIVLQDINLVLGKNIQTSNTHYKKLDNLMIEFIF